MIGDQEDLKNKYDGVTDDVLARAKAEYAGFGEHFPNDYSRVQRYRKLPVEIEAVQWPVKAQLDRGSYETACRIAAIHRWVQSNGGITEVVPAEFPEDIHVVIVTLEGKMRIDPGDWIIRGVKGEFYPCKPDIFDATYELVAADD